MRGPDLDIPDLSFPAGRGIDRDALETQHVAIRADQEPARTACRAEAGIEQIDVGNLSPSCRDVLSGACDRPPLVVTHEAANVDHGGLDALGEFGAALLEGVENRERIPDRLRGVRLPRARQLGSQTANG